MKLKYELSKLNQVDLSITSSDSIVELTSDVEAQMLGIFKLSNGSIKVLQFVQRKDNTSKYQARLIIDELDLPHLEGSSFTLELINAEFERKTKPVYPVFDVPSIKLDVKHHVSSELHDVLKRIKQLEETIKFAPNQIISNLKIKNKDLIRPGMIPVAIDDKGTFVALYPFANMVTSVNGETSADGDVKLNASMIKLSKSDKTVELSLQQISDAVISLKTLVDKVSETLTSLTNTVNALDFRLSQHINNGTI